MPLVALYYPLGVLLHRRAKEAHRANLMLLIYEPCKCFFLLLKMIVQEERSRMSV